ncbi:hypothetical protein [Lapillicoccus sp.]|uniref:hypothetical protein n=1 Tax=Lapillicoccus sp. TaxID=1909287 RepID=UPI0025DEA212|nr:hypothetical protein [Lapillicoccus sp.]
MSFDDLPDDWKSRPLTDPRLAADVVDLFVRDDDRRAGAVAVLVCDDEHRLLQPVVVTMDADPVPLVDKQLVVERFTELVGHGLGSSLILAVARPRGAFLTDGDREWHEVAIRGCREAGIDLLGLFVVTRHTVREVVDPADTRQRRPA